MKSGIRFMEKKYLRFPLLAGMLALSAGSSLLGCLNETPSEPAALAPLYAPLPGLDADGFLMHPGDSLDESRLPSQSEVAGALEGMGYSKYEFQGKSVLVDGDMVMHRSDFLPTASGETPALAKTAQRFSWSSKVVNRNYTWRVRMSAPFNMEKGARMAMMFWMSEAKIKLRQVQWNEPADITIRSAYLGNGTISTGTFPWESNRVVHPGSSITVSTSIADYSAGDSYWVMIHEFGHCFGFDHTDTPYALLIPGTPRFDPRSFMNSGFDRNSIMYTDMDRKAIHIKYP
jgi:hypothetical protein